MLRTSMVILRGKLEYLLSLKMSFSLMVGLSFEYGCASFEEWYGKECGLPLYGLVTGDECSLTYGRDRGAGVRSVLLLDALRLRTCVPVISYVVAVIDALVLMALCGTGRAVSGRLWDGSSLTWFSVSLCLESLSFVVAIAVFLEFMCKRVCLGGVYGLLRLIVQPSLFGLFRARGSMFAPGCRLLMRGALLYLGDWKFHPVLVSIDSDVLVMTMKTGYLKDDKGKLTRIKIVDDLEKRIRNIEIELNKAKENMLKERGFRVRVFLILEDDEMTELATLFGYIYVGIVNESKEVWVTVGNYWNGLKWILGLTFNGSNDIHLNYGREEMEAQWALAERRLHGLQARKHNIILNEKSSSEILSETAKQAKRRAEVARYVVKGGAYTQRASHVGQLLKPARVDIDTIQLITPCDKA
ncbi:hypothetical protein Tco_0522915 [Tanacetum coccineum]